MGAQLCSLLAERVAGVVEDDQGEPRRRLPACVPRDEALQQVVQFCPLRIAREAGQSQRELVIGDRRQRQPGLGGRQLDDLDIAVERFGDEERLHAGVVADGGLQVLDCPETLGRQDVALGEDLDHPQVGGGGEALPDGVGGDREATAGGQEYAGGVNGALGPVLH